MTTLARIVPASAIASVVMVAGVDFRLTVGRWLTFQLDSMDLDVTRFVIAIPRIVPSRIGTTGHVVSYSFGASAQATPKTVLSKVSQAIMRGGSKGSNSRSDRVGSLRGESLMTAHTYSWLAPAWAGPLRQMSEPWALY